MPYQKFKPNLEIPASIVNVENSECYTTIINSSDNEQYFDIEIPMEVDDFEIPTNESQMPNFDEAQINRYLNENIRTKHHPTKYIPLEQPYLDRAEKTRRLRKTEMGHGTQNTNADALSRIELNPLETESMIVNIDDEELEELLHTDENIRLSAEEIENIINDLEGENDLLDTINSNMEDGPPNSIPIQEEDFMKGYLQPNRKYYIMFDLEETYKQFCREYCKLFGQNGPEMIRCTKELEVVEDEEKRNELIKNHYEGKTNHRGITQTISYIR
ncbi:hypothetical protein QE152_g19498 [Popillia japonica]|uniref:Uncharacterized protein n=1 Tax=Popillia japonica TaxID=7064 RepID=A0AAW1KSX0_POPJA